MLLSWSALMGLPAMLTQHGQEYGSKSKQGATLDSSNVRLGCHCDRTCTTTTKCSVHSELHSNAAMHPGLQRGPHRKTSENINNTVKKCYHSRQTHGHLVTTLCGNFYLLRLVNLYLATKVVTHPADPTDRPTRPDRPDHDPTGPRPDHDTQQNTTNFEISSTR